jgi:hypothetical protein
MAQSCYMLPDQEIWEGVGIEIPSRVTSLDCQNCFFPCQALSVFAAPAVSRYAEHDQNEHINAFSVQHAQHVAGLVRWSAQPARTGPTDLLVSASVQQASESSSLGYFVHGNYYGPRPPQPSLPPTICTSKVPCSIPLLTHISQSGLLVDQLHFAILYPCHRHPPARVGRCVAISRVGGCPGAQNPRRRLMRLQSLTTVGSILLCIGMHCFLPQEDGVSSELTILNKSSCLWVRAIHIRLNRP